MPDQTSSVVHNGRRKYILCWAFLRIELLGVSYFRSLENLKVSMVVTGLLDVVRGNSAGGGLFMSSVLSSVERVQLKLF